METWNRWENIFIYIYHIYVYLFIYIYIHIQYTDRHLSPQDCPWFLLPHLASSRGVAAAAGPSAGCGEETVVAQVKVHLQPRRQNLGLKLVESGWNHGFSWVILGWAPDLRYGRGQASLEILWKLWWNHAKVLWKGYKIAGTNRQTSPVQLVMFSTSGSSSYSDEPEKSGGFGSLGCSHLAHLRHATQKLPQADHCLRLS